LEDFSDFKTYSTAQGIDVDEWKCKKINLKELKRHWMLRLS
jgi:hypothetical protein